MKRATKIILPIILALALIACTIWYLFIYDRAFTRDILLSGARYFEKKGNHDTAQWFYNVAYKQDGNNDAVAIELAEQYKDNGNYTKAEYTLYKAIQDGGGIDLYIELCKMYVEQDKIFDAVNLMNNVTGETKRELERLRPDAPSASPDKGSFSQIIDVTIDGGENTVYYNTLSQYPSTATGKYSTPIRLSEGKVNIYAISVNELGLVSPLALYQYEIGNIVQKVSFNDAAIEQEIRTILENDDPELLSSDLWNITSFNVPADAKDYSDLKYLSKLESITIDAGQADQLIFLSELKNLKTLEVTDTSVSSNVLQEIGKMKKLERLVLNNCGISSIASLSELTSLQYLNLSGNAVADISPIQSFTNLQELYLKDNALADLSHLSNCTNLTKLDIANNSAITTLTPLFALSKLSWLDASENKIPDITGIDALTNLSNLYLTHNALTDISVLANCSKLVDLAIDKNSIGDISALAALNSLMYLNFANNQVTAIPQWNSDCSLVTIDGSHNLIADLKALGGINSLNNVYMDYNADISSVEPLATCHSLIRVNVYGTKVTDVSMLTSQSIIVNFDPTQ